MENSEILARDSRKVLRVGLLGPGSIADQRLIPALNRLAAANAVVFWSVCGRDRERAQAFADRHGAQAPAGRQAFDDTATFLADPELDCVIIASPDRLHADQVIACARAGKHVFVEKPLAVSVAGADAVCAAVETAGVQLAVGYHLRFHNGHKILAEKIRAGDFGRPLHLHINWSYKSSPDDWRNSAASGRWWSLAAVGTHCLDLADFLFGGVCGAIVDLQATLNTDEHGGPHDESAVVSLRFASGATASIVCNMNYTATRLVEVTGSKASATAIDTLGPRGSGTITVNRQALDFAVVDPYEAELGAFLAGLAPLAGPGSASVAASAPAHAGLVGPLGGKFNVELLERASAKGKS